MIGNTTLRSMWLQTYIQAASVWHSVAELRSADVVDALVEELNDLIIAVARRDVEAVGYVERVHIGYGFNKVKDTFP